MMSFKNRALVQLLRERRVKIHLATGKVSLNDPFATLIKEDGYWVIKTIFEGGFVHVAVHRFVAYLKYGERIFDPELDIHHKDLNRLNNRAANLQLLAKINHRHFHRSRMVGARCILPADEEKRNGS